MKKILAALICLFCLQSLPARATDYTGIWWNVSESGWGVEIVQQNSIMFVTLYVYDGGNQPTWYSASSVTKAAGSSSWTGSLYRTTGPAFYSAWGSPPVGVVPAGTITFTPTDAHHASLQYTITTGAAVAVSKTIERYTFKSLDVAGSYYGGFQGSSACLLGSSTPKDRRGDLSLSVSGTSVVMSTLLTTGQGCQFAGTLEQHGNQYKITNGAWQCNTPTENGVFSADEVMVSDTGLTGKYSIAFGSGPLFVCHENGNFGGIKH